METERWTVTSKVGMSGRLMEIRKCLERYDLFELKARRRLTMIKIKRDSFIPFCVR